MVLRFSTGKACFRTGSSFIRQACYHHQKNLELPSSISQYGHMLKISSSSNQLNQIYAQILVHGLHHGGSLTAKLIHHLTETGELERASLVFNWVDSPDVFLWTSMIRAFSRFGPVREAIIFYARMRNKCILPNNFSFPFALKSCAALRSLHEGEQIHTDILKLGLVSDIFVQTALLDMYVKCGKMEMAKQVFDSMEVKNVVSWTAIVAGYCKSGLLKQAQEHFDQMPARNIVTWNVMLDGLTRFGDIETARLYFDKMPQRNTVSWTTMINGYSRSGDVLKARFLFDQTVEKESIAWTAMISCYIRNGLPGKAIDLFLEMQVMKMKPDVITILAIISAITDLRSLYHSSWIETLISEGNYDSDIRILNAIVNMYIHCGSIEKALTVFEKIPKKDLISYNSIITGLASHGNAKEALSLFTKMTQENIKPNEITFIGILTACAHGGLVEEGRRYFKLMVDLGYIHLKPEHFSCMVDILSRAGCLDEAYRFILGVNIRAEASIWGALLGACKIHGNLRLGQIVAKRLFIMEPNNAGNYAILANLYSEKGMWEEAASVRRAMKESKVVKPVGSSWAEVGNVVDGS